MINIASFNVYCTKDEKHGMTLRSICRVHFLVSVRIPRINSLSSFLEEETERMHLDAGNKVIQTIENTPHTLLKLTNIIHHEKTKKITTVTVVWICVPYYHEILSTLALNFSKNY